MAKIIGIDIQNRHVRAVLLVTSYRKITLQALSEIDRTQTPGLDEAVQACLVPLVPHSDAVAVAVDGDVAFIHRLRLPPTALKQLSEVIPFELEAQVPIDIEELVYDFVQLPRESSADSIDVLAGAVRTEHVRQRLALIQRAVSREAQRVGVGALPLANLANVTPELSADLPVAVVELGEDRSEVVVLRRGQPAYARTLSIGVSGLPETAPQLAAQLRQTMASASLALASAIGSVFLTGGGAAAAGAIDYLAAEVQLPVTHLPPPRIEGLTDDQIAALPRFSRALGLALGLRGRAKDLDLRRGGLSYQRGFAFLKEKAPLLASLGGVILLSFFFSTWAELRSLSHEHEKLSTDLAALTKDALGEETTDPDHARELLEGATARAEVDPMPHIDGFDTMVELSKAVPTTIVHDVEEMDFSREHLKLRGIVSSAAEAQQIADALKTNKCFTDVKITKVSQVVNGTRQKYQLESDLKCPEDAVANKKTAEEEGEK
ncbi:MAG TPA: pilus assembly protein PilM [Polyangiaceae bacterium]|jgi:general secretion pathway protein L|nr:pilus assembly protein PilM [Polyangiaceae bacterium]